MKIQNISTARAIWLIPTNEFNPFGRNLNHAVSKIVERYSFIHFTPLAKLYGQSTESPSFEGGSFITGEGDVIEVSVTIHNDGIVANSKASTEITERFLVDIMTWLSDEFGTVAPANLSIKKIYLSEVNFSFDKPPSFFSKEVDFLSKTASSMIKDKRKGSFGFSGITLGTDPELSKNPSTFKIERTINSSHDENRYYSAAPFHTSEHLLLIEKFEALFS